MKSNWYYPVVFEILLVLILVCFSACQKPEQYSTTESATDVPEPELIGDNWYCEPPTSSDNTVVGYEYVTQCISAYNLETGIKQQILKLPEARGLVGTPCVYGDKAVYVSGDINFPSAQLSGSGRPVIDANWVVSLLDLKTGEVKNLTTDDHKKLRPKIYGSTVVWLDARNNQDKVIFDVYAYDLKTNSEKRLTSVTSAIPYELALNGNWVVWRDGRNGEADHLYDIYAYNLRDNLEKRLTSASSRNDEQISVCGNFVVWTDSRHLNSESFINGFILYDHTYNSDIYLYDLKNDKERRITSYPGKEHYPVMDGDWIVWVRETDERSGDIFAFNLNTGQEVQVSHTDNAWCYPASVKGNKVFWIDGNPRQIVNGKVVYNGGSGVAGLYLYDLNTNIQRSLDLPANLLNGKASSCYPKILTDRHAVYFVGSKAGNIWTYALKIAPY